MTDAKPTTPREQIDKLARFIVDRIPGEPSASQGAVDTAIRLLEGQEAKIRAAVAEEREACATEGFTAAAEFGGKVAVKVAAAIRARGNGEGVGGDR